MTHTHHETTNLVDDGEVLVSCQNHGEYRDGCIDCLQTFTKGVYYE